MKPEAVEPHETADKEFVKALAKQIGQRIKDWRNALGYEKQAPFSDLIELNIGMLKKYEAGKNVPGGVVLNSFATRGLNINWLLTGDGDMFIEENEQQAIEPTLNRDKPNAMVFEDKERLVAALAAVEEGLKSADVDMPPDKKAELVFAAYELMAESSAARSKVVQFIRAIA